MNPKICKEFEDWIKNLPQRRISSTMKRHLEECEPCRKQIDQLNSVVETLTAVKLPQQLSETKLKELAELAQRTAVRQENRYLTFRLALVSFLCLPLVILINWLWVSVGYNLLASYVSLSLAQAYRILFISIAAGLSGLFYGSIPMLAGMLRRYSGKEIAT